MWTHFHTLVGYPWPRYSGEMCSSGWLGSALNIHHDAPASKEKHANQKKVTCNLIKRSQALAHARRQNQPSEKQDSALYLNSKLGKFVGLQETQYKCK
eukprot:scaffold24134_cov20-Tisochrysis_lutea.AAC.3